MSKATQLTIAVTVGGFAAVFAGAAVVTAFGLDIEAMSTKVAMGALGVLVTYISIRAVL